MPHTVTVKALSGLSTDGYGTVTYTTGTGYTARVVDQTELVVDADGTQHTSSTVAYIASTSTFPPTSLYTLPGGDTPEVLSVRNVPDQDGLHHVKVLFR